MKYLIILSLIMFTTCAIAGETLSDISKVKETLSRYKLDNIKPKDIKMYTVIFTYRKITDQRSKAEGPEYFVVPRRIIYPADLKVTTHRAKMGWMKSFPYELNKEYLLFCSRYNAFPLVFENTKKNINDILTIVNSGP